MQRASGTRERTPPAAAAAAARSPAPGARSSLPSRPAAPLQQESGRKRKSKDDFFDEEDADEFFVQSVRFLAAATDAACVRAVLARGAVVPCCGAASLHSNRALPLIVVCVSAALQGDEAAGSESEGEDAEAEETAEEKRLRLGAFRALRVAHGRETHGAGVPSSAPAAAAATADS